ncbi:hypothetical protein RFI36_14560 [Acinetobacter gerneri]|uniref:DUF676 domain-containing protein n=1 Tax=Acinetobacter gerneri TaxID=202952 RepID=A0AAW8JK40_9GAMM|nr:hypothetical protein [Acinetobacter gerneri]MDQ9010926.1 hypothetical protein [Acinetobacter gerneri]MDQ9015062.1 hypothetical protein [Acinetobacter gerneri]MDQ9026231.1 hypothetical protein [Acinetobacter gerneri]MDQ9053512.1 hypothetical protein [Acinetobacter gerneri]MDQ9061131.1 hypothetical protein [Acinetobacter gerneri]
MSNSYHHLPACEVSNGQQTEFHTVTTPSSSPTTCLVEVPRPYVVPIIFIPGIMGSNIKQDGKKVWYPPNGLKSVETLIVFVFKTAKTRQKQLSPIGTEVGFDGEINYSKRKLPKLSKAQLKKRGWGSVWWTGYGEILEYLEKYLNYKAFSANTDESNVALPSHEWCKVTDIPETNISSYEQKIDAEPDDDEMDQENDTETDTTDDPSTINKTQDQSTEKKKNSKEEKLKTLGKRWNVVGGTADHIELLTREMHLKLSDCYMPVYAMGYNWLQSNHDSAISISERLDQVKEDIKNEYPHSEFKKFIIVSHSMGGLVTRSLIQLSEKSQEIGGVVHGVMPASGAPAVYQRMLRGWDGFLATSGIWGGIKGWAVKFMFGHESKRMTAVLANSPGALQLLPFSNFAANQTEKGWLILKAQSKQSQQWITVRLPQTDNPYQEMYVKRDVWWQMINPDYIDLSEDKKSQDKGDGFEKYVTIIQNVKDFHESIADQYHDNTYAHYSADKDHGSFNSVTWVCQEKIDISNEEDLINFTEKFAAKITQDTLVQSEEIDQNSNDQMQEDDSSQMVEENYTKDNDELAWKEKVDYKNPDHNGLWGDGHRLVELSSGETVRFRMYIRPEGKGDGTVCAESGADIKREREAFHPKKVFEINGYDHSGSYNNKWVQLNSLYCIGQIVNDIID